jgi:hypothetical protein
MSRMAPGSGAANVWPLTQQKALFSIFGDVEDMIGVKLTDRYLMVPIKSVSGIFFLHENPFVSCMLCPRENCVGRRAPYDRELERKYETE